MPTQLFDLRVVDDGEGEVRPLSVGDRSRLYQQPSITDHKTPTGTREVFRDTGDEEAESLELSIGELPEAYDEVVQTAKNLLTRMRERIGELPYIFDPMERPDLSAAVSALFGEVHDRITYSMYQQAKAYSNDIALELADGATGA